MMILLLFITSLFAQNNPQAVALMQEKIFFKDKTKIKNPFEIRDPFKAPVRKRRDAEQKKLFQEGVFSNIPGIENVPIKNIKITGVFLGRERRAIAKIIGVGTDKNSTVILKEGMKLGQDDAELKAILPGGIVLVEKIINVYGQEEYLETIIPISQSETE